MAKSKFLLITAIAALFLAGGLTYYFFSNSDDSVTQGESLLSPEDQNRAKQGLDAAKRAVEEAENNPEVSQNKEKMFGLYVQLAQHYRLLGNLEEAKKAYERAIEVGVYAERAWSALAGVFEEMNRPQDAHNAINEAIKLMPANPDYWRVRLAIEENSLNYTSDDLEKSYAEALDSTGGHLDIVTSYARFLENKKGDYEAAIEQWQRAAEINPANAELYKQQIARLRDLIGQ